MGAGAEEDWKSCGLALQELGLCASSVDSEQQLSSTRVQLQSDDPKMVPGPDGRLSCKKSREYIFPRNWEDGSISLALLDQYKSGPGETVHGVGTAVVQAQDLG